MSRIKIKSTIKSAGIPEIPYLRAIRVKEMGMHAAPPAGADFSGGNCLATCPRQAVEPRMLPKHEILDLIFQSAAYTSRLPMMVA